MDSTVIFQRPAGLGSERIHVLTILQDRYIFAMLVGFDAIQAFEHFVSFDEEPAVSDVVIRKNRAPDRMRMQHRAGSGNTNDRQMQQGFRRWLALVGPEHVTVRIDFKEVVHREPALVHRTAGYGQTKWLAADDNTEVSAGPQHPAAPVKVASQLSKVFCRSHAGEL